MTGNRDVWRFYGVLLTAIGIGMIFDMGYEFLTLGLLILIVVSVKSLADWERYESEKRRKEADDGEEEKEPS